MVKVKKTDEISFGLGRIFERQRILTWLSDNQVLEWSEEKELLKFLDTEDDDGSDE